MSDVWWVVNKASTYPLQCVRCRVSVQSALAAEAGACITECILDKTRHLHRCLSRWEC